MYSLEDNSFSEENSRRTTLTDMDLRNKVDGLLTKDTTRMENVMVSVNKRTCMALPQPTVSMTMVFL